jgi:5-methylcytosine-specific restriction enzyme subunit McrC
VPPRRSLVITELQSQVVDGLTEDEAAALHELGRQLRGAGHWRQQSGNAGTEEPEGADVEDSDDDDSGAIDGSRSAIRVSRQPKSSGWSVTVHNAIGAVSVGDLQILVEPKIPTSHFTKLFSLATDSHDLRVAAGSLHLEAENGAVPAVWIAFLDALSVTLRADLHHDYVEVTDDPPFLRGHLDLRAVAVNLARGRLRFPAIFDDLSVDNPVNRTLRSACLNVVDAASRVSASLSHALGEPQYQVHRLIERRAREASYRLSQVGDLRPGDLDVPTPRLAVHQLRALMIARHILSGIGRRVRVGDAEASCYLLPTPPIAESAVRNLLSTAMGPEHVVTKRGKKVAGLSFNPDLVVDGSGQKNLGTIATGDVKYRLRRENWPRTTLEQAITFRQVFGAKLGFFVDFSAGDTSDADLSINIGGIEFHRVSWPAHDSVDPESAATRMVSSCRAFLDPEV